MQTHVNLLFVLLFHWSYPQTDVFSSCFIEITKNVSLLLKSRIQHLFRGRPFLLVYRTVTSLVWPRQVAVKQLLSWFHCWSGLQPYQKLTGNIVHVQIIYSNQTKYCHTPFLFLILPVLHFSLFIAFVVYTGLKTQTKVLMLWSWPRLVSWRSRLKRRP